MQRKATVPYKYFRWDMYSRSNIVFLVSIEVKWANLNGFVLLSEKGMKLKVFKPQNQHKL